MNPLVAESQFEDLANQHRAGRFGMWVFLGSEVLFFGALGALYFGHRAAHPAECAAASHHAKLVLGTANTFVLLTSSLCVALAVEALREGRARNAQRLVLTTIALALLFTGLKGTEWFQHFAEGIRPGAAYDFPAEPSHAALLYFTLYYAMTGLHALHVVVGIGLFLWVFRRLRTGRDSPASHPVLELVGLYWHFVDIVWLFLWPMFYLMH